MVSETRRLVAHDKLLLDVIKRQAGTLQKALLEATMNGIEAGADRIDVTFDPNGTNHCDRGAILRIVDNGNGIRERQELLDHFEQFGTPHDASEGKVWAQFRMGRGQCFAFGRNTWRTATWKMVVDIDGSYVENDDDPNGLDYRLQGDLDFHDGCDIQIDLYRNPIGDWGLRTVEVLRDNFKKQIEFMPGVITFNGEQLNTPPEELNWSQETDDAYYLFNAGGQLSFYNLGAYIMDWSPTQAGVTGVIVSKKMLKVNFARNDIQSDCEVFQRIQEVVKENRVKKTRSSSRRLNSNERTAVLLDIRDGIQSLDDVKTIGLFETTSGKVLKFSDIRNNSLPWCFAEDGDRIADRLMESDEALCISESVLDSLNYSGDHSRFFEWLIDRTDSSALDARWKSVSSLWSSFSDVTKGLSSSTKTVPHKKLTKVEKRVLRVLNSMPYWDNRRVVIGISDAGYLGWTDGQSYIAIDRNYLRQLSLSTYWGAADLLHTLFHETAHDDDSTGTHIHGLEFYHRFHEITYRSNGSYGYCPLGEIGTFADKLKNAVRKERQEELERKEARAKAHRNKALGLDKHDQEDSPTDDQEVEIAARVRKEN